jgi:hypothetical protein
MAVPCHCPRDELAICSFFARGTARFSSGRGRIPIYLETSSHLLRSPIAFRSPRSIPFSSTKPAPARQEVRLSERRRQMAFGNRLCSQV